MPKTVLVVDDRQANLDILKGILAPEYKVKTAVNGPMAIKIALSDAPDLILLDIVMPGPNGFEVCKTLKSYRQTRNIPIIFVSASCDPLDEIEGFKVGAADFTRKPINPKIIMARIDRLLRS